MYICIRTFCNPVVLEVQLLSEADINSGVNVTFPMKDMTVPVKSEIPNPTLSMQIVKFIYIRNSTNSILNSL